MTKSNRIVVLLPFILVGLGAIFINRDFGFTLVICGMFSAAIVGLIQVAFGIALAFRFPRNRKIWIYLGGVMLFFVTMYLREYLRPNEVFPDLPLMILFAVTLAGYFTFHLEKGGFAGESYTDRN
ncbi:MAG: hypothetical protein JJU02_03495 [Cryomorphaceae bacterium]|nr:hypothetical protein [Cryomorphaceae bacterium]